MKNYPSNITREEFELIRDEFESVRKRTKPRKVDLYEVFCAISGIKRHIAVDINDLPHAIHVTTAIISDKAGALEMVKNDSSSLTHVINIFCDGGYVGKWCSQILLC